MRCCWASLVLLLGAILVLIGLLLLILVPIIIRQQVNQNAVLRENGLVAQKWANPAYDVRTHIWTFSVVNPDDVVHGNKPQLTRKGPYVFRQQQQKRHVVFTDSSTVRYRNFKTYNFDPALSCPSCTLADRLWIPNMVYQKFVEAASSPDLALVAAALSTQTPFLEVSVSEMLFQGYRDPFMRKACSGSLMEFVCKDLLNFPDRIGFFEKKNGSSDGVYEVESGMENVSDIGRVRKWNNESLLPAEWWSSEDVRAIDGTDGGLFHPHLSKSERLPVFVSDMCRSIYLEFKKEVTWRGMEAYRFVLPAAVMNTSLSVNEGFCSRNGSKRFFSASTQPGPCLPAGLLDISRCVPGEPPVVISMINFLYSSEEVQRSVEVEGGQNLADEDGDQTILDIEPTTGVVLQAFRKFQINVAMWKGVGSYLPAALHRFHSAVVPVLMLNETATIDEESRQMLQSRLIDVRSMAHTGGLVAVLLGVFFLLLGFGIMLLIYVNSKKKKAYKVSANDQSTTVQPYDKKTYSNASTMQQHSRI